MEIITMKIPTNKINILIANDLIKQMEWSIHLADHHRSYDTMRDIYFKNGLIKGMQKCLEIVRENVKEKNVEFKLTSGKPKNPYRIDLDTIKSLK